MKKYDYRCIVIGAGSGGLAFVGNAAALGLNNIALVEKETELGGECLNYGCVPSKALLHAAKTQIKDPFKHVRASIKKIEKRSDNVAHIESLGVKTFKGEATFVDKHTILVGGKRLRAKYFVIATGSSAFIPPIEGLSDGAYLTNETIFSLKTTPKSLVIVGGGPIGCEMATAFSQLGTKVTLLERGNRLLAAVGDDDASKLIERKLRALGVDLILKCPEYSVQWSAKLGRIAFKKSNKKSVTFNEILISTGRKPNTKLGLEAAKVKYGAAGIKVSSSLRTTKRNIYAVGDCTPSPKFTHLAAHQASVVLKSLVIPLFNTSGKRLIPTPSITYTQPEIGSFGMQPSSVQADSKLRVITHSLADNDRAVTDEGTTGFIKLVVDKAGRVKGGVVAADNASELLAPLLLLHYGKKKLRDLNKVVIPYPTLAFSLSSIASKEAIDSTNKLPGWEWVSRHWRK